MKKTVHLLIKGKVQGVFFRASAKEVAVHAGLKGWVRNTKSGDVEIVVSGSVGDIEQFIIWCGKGPSKAKVTDVTMTDTPFIFFETFEIRK